ncbi:hypothetical protein K9U40_07980 [Xanthobacter autotrophicus]|uniref:hypothetical protein n=1 Tax=Xanthobacter TaxID=279 RepID=UPI0024AB3A4E|nr:hypothetical protein [Xanthobacter autotrophicus]MDI4664270.1 hypothetical protein [Xanthobacter autotrophicus]
MAFKIVPCIDFPPSRMAGDFEALAFLIPPHSVLFKIETGELRPLTLPISTVLTFSNHAGDGHYPLGK